MSLSIYEPSTWIHTSCVFAGGAVVEERRSSCLQHLYGDSSRERGAGSLGPQHLPLPHTSASGNKHVSHVEGLAATESDVRKRHQITLVSFLRSLTLEQKACWEPACHLSSCDSSRGSAPSWAGTRRGRRLPSPAEPTGTPSASLLPSSWKTDRRARFSLTASSAPHTAETADGNNRVYITTLCVLWRGSVDKDARCAVYSICLLTAALWNCGPYRDKLYKHRGQGREEGGERGARGDGDWMSVGKCSSASVAITTVTTQLPWWQRIGWMSELGSGSSVQKEVMRGINNLVSFSCAGDNQDLSLLLQLLACVCRSDWRGTFSRSFHHHQRFFLK